MAHYSEDDARRVFDRDLAERQRPAVQRAAARLQGQPEPAPEPVVDEDAESDPGELAAGDDEG